MWCPHDDRPPSGPKPPDGAHRRTPLSGSRELKYRTPGTDIVLTGASALRTRPIARRCRSNSTVCFVLSERSRARGRSPLSLREPRARKRHWWSRRKFLSVGHPLLLRLRRFDARIAMWMTIDIPRLSRKVNTDSADGERNLPRLDRIGPACLPDFAGLRRPAVQWLPPALFFPWLTLGRFSQPLHTARRPRCRRGHLVTVGCSTSGLDRDCVRTGSHARLLVRQGTAFQIRWVLGPRHAFAIVEWCCSAPPCPGGGLVHLRQKNRGRRKPCGRGSQAVATLGRAVGRRFW